MVAVAEMKFAAPPPPPNNQYNLQKVGQTIENTIIEMVAGHHIEIEGRDQI